MGNCLNDLSVMSKNKSIGEMIVLVSLSLADNSQRLLLTVILAIEEIHSMQLFHQHYIFIIQHGRHQIMGPLMELQSNKDQKHY